MSELREPPIHWAIDGTVTREAFARWAGDCLVLARECGLPVVVSVVPVADKTALVVRDTRWGRPGDVLHLGYHPIPFRRDGHVAEAQGSFRDFVVACLLLATLDGDHPVPLTVWDQDHPERTNLLGWFQPSVRLIDRHYPAISSSRSGPPLVSLPLWPTSS